MESSPVAVTAGKTYRIGAWLRGELNEQAGQGDWRIRAQFYASNGTDLGYQEDCYGAGEHSLTWEWVKCYVKAPQNAATLRLQLWLVQNAGWVAFDDLTVDDLTIADWDGSTKYYTFNGQRIAMRQGSQLTYLHTDHLGSTKLLTDQAGNPVQAVAQYYAYGREQVPGSLAGLPTDYTFTGQRLDDTGLIYMNARYYDPEIGQFLSPDSLVPDASNLFDYNRYMYARGNPMRYADPSGHCATTPSGASDDNDGECWRYANTILAQWDNTPGYWNERFYSKDNFLAMASNHENHADGFYDVLTQYAKSDTYKAWAAQHQDKPLQPFIWGWGDYTSFTGTFTPFEGSIIRDDYGHWYLKGALAIGLPGVSLKRGEIFFNTPQGYKKREQLNLTPEQASEKIPQVIEGASWGAGGSAIIFTTGPAENLTPPYDVTIETGLALPPGIGGWYSPWGYTVPFWR